MKIVIISSDILKKLPKGVERLKILNSRGIYIFPEPVRPMRSVFGKN